MVLFATALLVGLGAWTYLAVEGSLREIRANTLSSELEAEVRALRSSQNPEASLAALREVAIGERGELFALDRGGVLLSESRLTPGLKGRVLRSQLADGVAASASAEDTAGRRGAALEPYPNHRGEEVIGAWRWIPEKQFAIAAEIPEAQAYAPLRYLRIAFGAVFGALVLAVVAALWSGFSLARLRGELGGQRKVGPYRLQRLIGEGGMADIYLARHDLLKRPCAVKLLKPARATDEMVARFEREVQLASTLAHPNVVEIYDYGRSAEGLFYYAMEFLEGTNLGELLARDGSLPVARALPILRQLCAGLAAAHAAGLVHRDVKPENVMICRRGEEADVVKILDFGMVKKADAGHSRNLTRGLKILGTPLYMAPECLRNPADVDARTDIYAVGAVAFTILSGRKLFETADDLELSSKVLNDVPPRVSEIAKQPIPVELDLLIQACLEKKREDRPQRIANLVEALDAIAADLRA
ncbi:MAG: protein kinase [Burkholderiales bacterium]